MDTQSNSLPSNSIIIFSHIPKTAGTTLRHIIQYQFHPSEMFEFYRYSHRPDKGISKFRNLSFRKKERIKFISGHLGFGIHSIFPYSCSYITILRHPIDRVLSYYSHLVRTGKNNARGKTIEEFILSFGGVRNSMVCNLSGYTFRAQMGDLDIALEQARYSSDTLDLAIENMKRYFCMVGILEQFDETCLLLQKVLGWKFPIGHIQSNKAKCQAMREEIPKRTLAFIEKHNELDLQLYEYAKMNFSKQTKRQGDEFASDLYHLQSLEKKRMSLKADPERLLFQACSYYKRAFHGVCGLLQ